MRHMLPPWPEPLDDPSDWCSREKKSSSLRTAVEKE
jgi:hypothetical protein